MLRRLTRAHNGSTGQAPKTLGFEGRFMASSFVTSHSTQRYTTSDGHLNVAEPAPATVSPTEVGNLEELDLMTLA